jgi:CPA1 family monovalent cation:H+ antiporter
VPLAATLSIPLTDAAGPPLPQRDLVLVLATAVIVISLLVQGFTLAPLVRRVGLAVPVADVRSEYGRARLAQLDDIEADQAVPTVVLDQVRRALRTSVEMTRDDGSDAGRAARRRQGQRGDPAADPARARSGGRPPGRGP